MPSPPIARQPRPRFAPTGWRSAVYANDFGLGGVRVRDDGAVVIHVSDTGYHTANRLSAASSEVVGAYVHVITDDVPGAAAARDL